MILPSVFINNIEFLFNFTKKKKKPRLVLYQWVFYWISIIYIPGDEVARYMGGASTQLKGRQL